MSRNQLSSYTPVTEDLYGVDRLRDPQEQPQPEVESLKPVVNLTVMQQLMLALLITVIVSVIVVLLN